MPAVEWSTSELMQVTTALSNREGRSLAQISRDLSTTLGRPYSGVYSKVRELVNQDEHTPIIEINESEQTDPTVGEDGRSLLNYMNDKLSFYESKAGEIRSLLQEYHQEVIR